MFGPKIKIEKELLIKATEYAEKSGYSSVDEFISHLIEKEITRQDEALSEDKVKKRLQGLGYLS